VLDNERILTYHFLETNGAGNPDIHFYKMKNRIFISFLMQLVGILCIQTPILFIWLNSDKRTEYVLKYVFFDTAALIWISIIIIYFFNYLFLKIKSKIYIFGIIILFITIAPVIQVLISNAMKWLFWNDGLYWSLGWEVAKKVTISNYMIFLCITSIYLLSYYWIEFQDQKEKTLSATLLANEAQLKMLQYQINPHFLFNTITSVLSLIDENKSKAKNVLMSLSEYFRYTLNNKNGETVELSKEVEAIKKYLDIQKVRFEEKLEIEYCIDSKAEKLKVPFFILHPLVENAVKYGIKTSPLPLKIKIALLLVEHKNLWIEVINSGKIISSDSELRNTMSTSTGIDNLKKRLEIIYGEESSFSLTEENGNVRASISIKNIA
jgi:sensor histidine kinase YesM